jgi:hypothetical protein
VITSTNLPTENKEVFAELERVGTSSAAWQTSASREAHKDEAAKRCGWGLNSLLITITLFNY